MKGDGTYENDHCDLLGGTAAGGGAYRVAGAGAVKARAGVPVLRKAAAPAVEPPAAPSAYRERMVAVLPDLRTKNMVYRTKEGRIMGFQKSFKALGDPVRREILSLLRRGPMAAGDIAAHFDLSGATVSHHLAILRDAGLILDDRQGKYIYYELNMSVVDEILEWVSALRGEDRDEKNE